MLSFHYPSNHLLIQPVMHTPVLCQLQLSLLSSQDFFSLLYHDKRRCITDSARHYLSTLPVACYARMCMPNIDFQVALFQILYHHSTIVVSSIAPSFLFFLSSRPSTNANSTQKSINISVLLVVASGDRHALVIETMQSMLE